MTRRRVSHDGSETTARVAAAPLRAPAHRFVVARGQLHGGVLIQFPIVEKNKILTHLKPELNSTQKELKETREH